MTAQRLAVLVLCFTLAAFAAGCDSSSTPNPAPATAPGSNVNAQAATPPAVAIDATQPPTPEPPAVVRVNGQPIYQTDYENQVAQFQAAAIAQGLDPNTPDGQAQLNQLREQVLNGMIDQVLIEQEAQLKGIAVSDADFEAVMQEIIASAGGPEPFAAQLATLGQSEEQFRAGQRAAMLASLMRDQVIAGISSTAPQVHARHILVDNNELANSLVTQLQAGADFTSLAQQYSQDTLTRDGGGDLGWFPRGVLISREVEDAAFALQPGQISGVVQSAFGFHIVQAIETDPARPLTQEQLLTLQQATFESWLASLRSAANIQR